MSTTALILGGSFIVDSILGDPRNNWHPVVLIGNWISYLQKLLLRANQSATHKQVMGVFLLIFTIVPVYFLIYGLLYCVAFFNNFWLNIFCGALLLSCTISPRSLSEAGREIYNYLQNKDLSNARYKVGWIVGRDTDNLDESEIARATIETIAENITDGIISPLFFMLIGGVPFAFFYRAVNTLDSMVGYKNEQYIDFGKASARFDDLCNFIPARITSLLIIIISFFSDKLNAKAAAQMTWRDARKHPSPNSGYAEAAVAGAIGIRLGGLNYYFGKPSLRAYMGDALQDISAAHILLTIKIMYAVTIAFIILSISILSII